MRFKRANDCGDRSNALWGRGSRGESRSNALWGRGGRRAGVAVASLVVLFAMAAGGGYGHGTFVSCSAAGSAPGFAGDAPEAAMDSPGDMSDEGLEAAADGLADGRYVIAN